MSEETPKKRGRPKGRKDSYKRAEKLPDDKKQYNADSLSFLMKVVPYEAYKAHKASVPELKERFKKYIEECIKSGVKPSNLQAYSALGITKMTIYNWEHGKDEELKEFASYIKRFFAAYREKMMIDGEVNMIAGIFWQKNYDGLKDQQEHVITTVNPMGESQNENELAKKYLENAEIAGLPSKEDTTVIEVTAESAETIKALE